jgi:hypothetical protein
MVGALVGSAAKGYADYWVARKQEIAQAYAAARLVEQEIQTGLMGWEVMARKGWSADAICAACNQRKGGR